MGISKFDDILVEVRENLRKISSCEGPHEFDFDPDAPGTTLRRKYTCGKCGGVVDATDLPMYRQGLRHGGLQAQREIQRLQEELAALRTRTCAGPSPRKL